MNKWVKRILVVLGVIIVAIGAFIGFASFKVGQAQERVYTVPAFTIAEDVAKADVELGKRIVTIRNGCVDCHGQDLSGGTIIDDPAMGTFRGPNITPARLKDWTDEDIAKALRYGVDRQNKTLVFMPSYDFEFMSKSDIAAIIAYLRTVPSVETPETQPVIGPVGKVLYTLGKFPPLFPAEIINFESGFGEKPAEAPTADFGKYLATTTCSGCHGARLQGGPIPGAPPDWPHAPSLRLAAVGGWTEEGFKESLVTGVSQKTGQPMRPPMPVALTKQMNETEKQAIWLYLSTLN